MNAAPLRRICIGVDDYGLHSGIDDAALRLVEMGRVQSIGCMVGAAGWPRAARRLAPVALLARDRLDVGLHLDLTQVPLDTRFRRDHPRLLVASYLGLIDRRRLRTEIDAQLDAFATGFGRVPDFVDGHQHVHQLPTIRDVLLEALAARDASPRPWLRATRRPPGLGGPWRARAKAATIEWLGNRQMSGLADVCGYMRNRALLGVYGFDDDAQGYLGRLAEWFAVAADGDQLMCHPACRVVAGDPIAAARVAEFEALSGPAFESLLARESIVLTPVSGMLLAKPFDTSSAPRATTDAERVRVGAARTARRRFFGRIVSMPKKPSLYSATRPRGHTHAI